MLPTNRPPTHPGEMLPKEFLEPVACKASSWATTQGPSAPEKRLTSEMEVDS
jgi:plasmid maintenance system antidote protein VapI